VAGKRRRRAAGTAEFAAQGTVANGYGRSGAAYIGDSVISAMTNPSGSDSSYVTYVSENGTFPIVDRASKNRVVTRSPAEKITEA
jgi:hypothetical protein